MIHDSILKELCGNIPSIEKSILQISYIKRIECGIQIRFIHFVNDKDLLKMQKSIKGTSDDYNDNFNDMFIGLSPKYYTKKVFNQNKLEMLKMYYTHFELHSINSINYYDLIYYNEDELPNNIDTTIKTATNLFSNHTNDNNNINNTEVETELLLLRKKTAIYKKVFHDINKSFQSLSKIDKQLLSSKQNEQKNDTELLSLMDNEAIDTKMELNETINDDYNERTNTHIELQKIILNNSNNESSPLKKGESTPI